jgi:adenine/guanine phosphoribosyltransferase-like PRPP-binding protein
MPRLAFAEITRRLACWRFPENIDGVIGIASGGVVPAALAAQALGVELKMMALDYQDEANEPCFAAPRLLGAVPDIGTWRRVLLVDDVYVTGRSWYAARSHLPAEVAVLPFVFKVRFDFARFPDLAGWVQWPWKVESLGGQPA